MKLRTTEKFRAVGKTTVCNVFVSPLGASAGFVATVVYYKRPIEQGVPSFINFQHQNFFNSSASAVLEDCKHWIEEQLGEAMELSKDSGA